MAEFCLVCLNRINGTNLSERDVTLGNEFDICEGCGQWKQTVVSITGRPNMAHLPRWIKRFKRKV